MEKIAIIGGGLAGSLASVFLARRGFEVHVFERRPDMRKKNISAGKSINLALSLRGIEALKKAGLEAEILNNAIPMYGRAIHDTEGKIIYQPYGKEGQAIYSVSRGLLNIQLLDLAEMNENIHLHFDAKCNYVDLDSGVFNTEDENGNIHTYQADRIIGADGAFAATRARMQTRDRFDYSQTYLPIGYKELYIPPTYNGKHQMDSNALHIWPRGAYMLIALPNPPGDFTCTLFLSVDGNPGINQLNSTQAIHHFFKINFPDALELMPSLTEDFKQNPTGMLVTIRCNPWVYEDRLALTGDAAHAVVPFFGQGMNCSFEDVNVLDSCIEDFYPDWKRIFYNYNQLRKKEADAIADLAVQNFTEMAEKTGNPEFIRRKTIEHHLCEIYPHIFQSQYELVTFSNIPYSEAKKRGPINDAIIDAVIAEGFENHISPEKRVEEIIRQHLQS